MRKKLLTTLALLLMAVSGVWAQTSGECGDGVTWAYDAGTLTISFSGTGTGAMADYASASDQPWSSYQSSITYIIIENGVTSIGNSAFRNSGLTSITIPASVTSIGENAFRKSGLTSITIPASVTTIGQSAFYDCRLTSITIPASVTTIGKSAFYGCKLTSITLNEGLTTINEEAFSNNGTTIGSVSIPQSVTSIGNNAFNGTTVQNFYINNIPSKIDLNANSPFKATGTSIHVFTLMKNIFENATNWSKYKGHFVDDIEITHVESITLDNENMIVLTTKTGKLNATINPEDARVKDVTYTSSNNDIIAIVDAKAGTFIAGAEEGEATITCTANDGSGAFAKCKITVNKSFVPATSVTLNKTNASMEVGNSLKLTATITPTNATYKNIIWVSSDEDVAEVSNGTVTAVGPGNATITAISGDGNARANCVVTVSASGSCGTNVTWTLTGTSPDYTLTISGTGAMADYSDKYDQPWGDYRSSITSVVINDGVTSIGNSAFVCCDHLATVTIPNSMISIGKEAFKGCINLTSIEIPASVTSIGESAFWECTGLTSVTIADGSQLTSIGNGAFASSGLTSIVIPASVTSIGGSAFSDCTGLTSVTFATNSQLISIGENAFASSGLTSIVIPASVTSIGNSAFANTTATVYVLPSTPPTLDEYAFEGVFGTIYVHGDAYDSADGWTGLSKTKIYAVSFSSGATTSTAAIVSDGTNNYYTAGADITLGHDDSPGNTFGGYTVTKDGTDPEETVEVAENEGVYTFDMPAGDVTVTAKLEAIRFEIDGITYECTSGTTVKVARYNGTSSSLIIPESVEYNHVSYYVTEIGERAFEGNTSLVTIEMTNCPITVIGKQAFKNCTNLSSILLPDPLTDIEDEAFSGTNLTEIIIPYGVTWIDENVFEGCNGNLIIYVPEDQVGSYRSRWPDLNILAIGTIPIPYIAADGSKAYCTDYTVLNGSETSLGAGWYVVNSNISYEGGLTFNGGEDDVNLILCDGAEMSIVVENTSSALQVNGNSFNIYGQSGGSGKLNVTNTGTGNGLETYNCLTINGGTISANISAGSDAISCSFGDVVINGGNVTATATAAGAHAIYGKNVSILGGNVTANGTVATWSAGEDCGTITLGWRNAADRIKATAYSCTTLKIADYKMLTDGTNIYNDQTLYGSDFPSTSFTGTIDDPSVLNGQTLRPSAAVTESGTNEYTIWNADGWDAFCDRLAADDGKTFFSGKTVKLGADITVSRMAGGQPFTGTFDGDDHTLTLNYGTADAPVNEQFVAPFVATSADGSNQPVFRNLTIDGTIYDSYSGSEAHNVGGLIGHLYGDVTIEHCTSNLTITSVGGAGGFVGLCEHTAMFTDCKSSVVITSPGGNNSGFVSWSRASGHAISFEGCVFNGKLLQQNGKGSSNGCFIGWTGSNKTVTITNSLCAPAATTTGETMASDKSATFARGWNATTIATNSYYTEAFGGAQGLAAHTIAAGEGISIAHAGEPTVYDVSGITAYKATAQSTTFMAGLLYNNVIYAGSGDEVSLTLANTAPEGYAFDSYTVSPDGATLSGSDNPYTLTMPASNVTVTATWAQSQSNLGNCWHEPEAAEPTGTYMRNPIHPYASSGVNIYTGNQFQGDGENPGNQTGGTIYYRAEGASAWNMVVMEYDTEIEDNKYWRGTIPANGFAAEVTVEYVIEVIYDDHDPTYLGLAAAGDVASTVFGTLEEAAAHPFSFTYVTPNPVSYIDENGNEQTLQPGDYTVLTGGGETTLSEGWYVVNSTVKYAGTVTLNGDVNLILADDCTLNIGSEDDRITSGPCINADGKSLTVYGQTNQTGALKAYSNYEWYKAVKMKDYIQHGGKVIIDHSNGIALYLDGDLTLTRGTLDAKISAYAYAIALGNGHTATVSGGTLNANGASSGYAISGTLTVSGGTVNATCDGSDVISGNLSMTGGTVNVTNDNEYGNAIKGTLTFSGGNLTANGTIDGNVTLGWTSPDDRITATTYDGTVTIAAGQAFTDGQGNIYSGTLTEGQRKDIAGMTLVPSVITLAAKQVTVDGRTDYWTTFYSGDAGYGIDAEENACAYTATYEVEDEVGTITLHKLGKVIPKNMAVIIVGEDASISMTTSTAAAENTVSNHLHGVDVATLLSTVKSTYNANTILVLSNKNQHFGFHELATTNVPARKAFLAINEQSGARQFTMVFDDATGIHSIDNGQLIMDNEAGAWYSLDGRRLSGKPTQKGLYIHNGRKEVLK